jgi:glycine betaine transporter
VGLLFPEFINTQFNAANSFILSKFQNFYLIFALLIVLISVCLLFFPFAKRKLGQEKPEYSYFSWIALLYSTGMGSGLLLRAVQEPLHYFQHPPIDNVPPKVLSLQYTFFHWGITPWAMYSLFGLILAYYMYIRREKNYVDAIKATVANNYLKAILPYIIILITISGVIASLGLGTGQFIGGLNQYFNLELGTKTIIITGLLIGIIGTLSALTGISKVIKYLANFDVGVSLALLLFISFFIKFPDFISNTFQAVKGYVLHFFEMSLTTGGYNVSEQFTKDWTVFYWAFWLSWVPFTGIFIARISKGRTIREFLIATIIVPTVATIIWFSVFANNAFELVKISDIEQYNNVFTSLFVFLKAYPFSSITVIVAATLVLVAIINSVDSAIFVLSIFSDKGEENPSKPHKLFWGIIITVLAVGLLAVGASGLLSAISNFLVIMALPFSFLYCIIIISFIKSLYKNGIKSKV